MLEGCIRSAGLQGAFDSVLSTDQGENFQASSNAYQLGMNSLRLRKQEIFFAAFAG
jgi:2-haloacid dehalogenase